MAKPSSLEGRNLIRRVVPGPDCGERAGAPQSQPIADLGTTRHAPLAVKGEAIPSLGYDLHDPNFPFGRAVVVSIPDTAKGAEGVSRDVVLPAIVAPVVDTLVAALAEKDHRIDDLKRRLVTTQDGRDGTNAALRTLAPPRHKKRWLGDLLCLALLGRDVRATLDALNDVEFQLDHSDFDLHRVASAGLDLIFQDATDIIDGSRHLIETKIRCEGVAPRDIIIFILMTIAEAKLRSGLYHDRHEGLSPYGYYLFGLWGFSCGELVISGQITQDEANRALAALEHETGMDTVATGERDDGAVTPSVQSQIQTSRRPLATDITKITIRSDDKSVIVSDGIHIRTSLCAGSEAAKALAAHLECDRELAAAWLRRPDS